MIPITGDFYGQSRHKPSVGWPVNPGLLGVMGNCVGCWPMTEGTGASGTVGGVHSVYGRAPSGILSGGAVWTQGQFGWCVKSPNTTGVITVANTAALKPTKFSLSIWLNYTTTANNVIYEADGNSGYSLQGSGSGVSGGLTFNVGGGGSSGRLSTTKAYNDGKWHHVGIIYNGPGVGSFYVDGVKDQNTDTPGTPSYSTGALFMLSRNGTAGQPVQIDMPTFFNAPLVPDALRWFFRRPLDIFAAEPIIGPATPRLTSPGSLNAGRLPLLGAGR